MEILCGFIYFFYFYFENYVKYIFIDFSKCIFYNLIVGIIPKNIRGDTLWSKNLKKADRGMPL